MGEIPRAEAPVVCDGRRQAGGKCGVDLGSGVSSGWGKKCMT